MTRRTELHELARRAAAELRRRRERVVLAESCTAGLVAATLGGVPGVSEVLCGSAVVYQERSKTAWLDVPEELLARCGAVSAEVAVAMTEGVLRRTPHATLAASITGHLGPGVPADADGVLFIAVGRGDGHAAVTRHRLPPTPSDAGNPLRVRRERQGRAAGLVLRRLLAHLAGEQGTGPG